MPMPLSVAPGAPNASAPWSAQVADALAARTVAIVPDALPQPVVAALRAEALARDAAGGSRQAHVGRGHGTVADPATRGDRIAWLAETATLPAERAYAQMM